MVQERMVEIMYIKYCDLTSVIIFTQHTNVPAYTKPSAKVQVAQVSISQINFEIIFTH